MNRSWRRDSLRLLTLIPIVWWIGCTGAKQARQTNDIAAGRPPVTLSSDQIHSPSGDMSARVPQDWVMVDAEKLEAPQVFSMACNPDYTLSLIFTEVTMDNATRGLFSRDGLKGLAEASFQRRIKRSNARAVMTGDVEEFAIGKRRFGAYTYTTDTMKTLTRVAIFNTGAHIYECAITHLDFNDRALPPQETLRNVHQIILGSIEW
ncbi:MAG: hypothetical protein ABIR47_07515 [Candidatus Kapaibacterium sp.]